MELELSHYLIALFGAFVAGGINALSGSGSVITLAILMEVLGMPGNLANGTNRVGIIMQGVASSAAYRRNGKLNFTNRSLGVMIPVVLGAIVGVIIAVNISNDWFEEIFKYLILLMLGVILVKPSRWLREKTSTDNVQWWIYPLFFLIGIYGGFINMGYGIFFLVLAVLVAKFNMIEANAVKNFVVVIYTAIVLAIFHWQGLVDWKVGGVMAVGQASGGFIFAHLGSKYKGAELWAYRLLVVMVILVVLKAFGIFSLVYNLIAN